MDSLVPSGSSPGNTATEKHSYLHPRTSARVFTARLFTAASNLETAQMLTNQSRSNVDSPIVEYYTTRMSHQHIVLSKHRHRQTSTQRMIPFTWSSRTGKTLVRTEIFEKGVLNRKSTTEPSGMIEMARVDLGGGCMDVKFIELYA